MIENIIGAKRKIESEREGGGWYLIEERKKQLVHEHDALEGFSVKRFYCKNKGRQSKDGKEKMIKKHSKRQKKTGNVLAWDLTTCQ